MIVRVPLEHLGQHARPDLRSPQIVTGIETVDQLHSLAGRLGRISRPGVGMAGPTLDNDDIYEIRVRNGGQGDRDTYGHTIYSTLADAFPLHTDGYNSESPPDVVLLHRTDGTHEDPSMFTASAGAVSALHSSVLHELCRPQFPSAVGPVALVSSVGGLRFNLGEIMRWEARSGNLLRPAARSAIDSLVSVLDSEAEELHLSRHECLVLDNRRFAHGRSALLATSKRVLNRIWLTVSAPLIG